MVMKTPAHAGIPCQRTPAFSEQASKTLAAVDRFINVKKKNNFGFQHSIWAYFVPFIDIKTYAKNH